MRISVLKERRTHERRVAGSPETVKKFTDLGAEVVVESGAGAASGIPDSAFEEAGGSIAETTKAALANTDLVLKVQRPMMGEEGENELELLSRGQVLVCQMSALTEHSFIDALAKAGVTGFAMELIPRISRAQSMDVLSSQSNLAGYRAVIEAIYEYRRIFPMMMTAAGTLPPARVVITTLNWYYINGPKDPTV